MKKAKFYKVSKFFCGFCEAHFFIEDISKSEELCLEICPICDVDDGVQDLGIVTIKEEYR